jgi:hypothetical protein
MHASSLDRSRRVVNLACLVRLACAAIALAFLPRPVAAQVVTEPALKAAGIYQFAQFSQWPADVLAPDAPLLMCLSGDAAVSEELVRTVKGRMLSGHRMDVVLLTPEAPRATCHVLYVSGVTAAQATKMIAGLLESPVLTISDIEGFSAGGGIAELFFVQGRLAFSVLLSALKRSRLQISSRLLRLAVIR